MLFGWEQVQGPDLASDERVGISALETLGVPLVGLGTRDFPAFWR